MRIIIPIIRKKRKTGIVLVGKNGKMSTYGATIGIAEKIISKVVLNIWAGVKNLLKEDSNI